MANDPERDIIPIKEIKDPLDSSNFFEVERNGHRPSVADQRAALQLSRNEVEDNLFHLKEENLQLKKTSRKQEEQLKKLATKVSRLLSEKKKLDLSTGSGRKRDIEMEEMVEDLQEKVRTLEKNNAHLREKLLVAKQQVIVQTRKPNAYPHIGPKVNTGRPRSYISPYYTSANVRGKNVYSPQRKAQSTPLSPYGIQLLEEARNELSNFKELCASQKAQIDIYEEEIELLKEQLHIKENEFEDDVNHLKSQITQGQRQHVQENLDLIRLHRELKQKNAKYLALQTQYTELEEKLKAQKLNHDRLLKEIDDLNNSLKEEQKKSVELIAEIHQNKAALSRLIELEENLKSVQKENSILKETNDKLIESFSTAGNSKRGKVDNADEISANDKTKEIAERDSDVQTNSNVLNKEKEKADHSLEQMLQNRISELESVLKEEANEKSSLKEENFNEKEKFSKLSDEHSSLQENFAQVKGEMEELKSKVDILKSEEVDFDELGEALALIKLKKQRSIKLNFLENMPGEEEEDLKSKLKKSEADHVETIKELCSVREMLMTQYKLNKDMQNEMQSLTEKFAQQEKEYQTKLEEYAHLLDIRAARIQKLERQLNDIAYGTKKYKFASSPEDQELEADEQVELSWGENIFEIHVDKVIFSSDGLKIFGGSSPSSFITWTFYEFELQSTPIVKGSKPYFNCTAQYTVKVDDFFLYYIHKHSTMFELHESLGTEYRTTAACRINFSEVIDQPHGRLHGSQQLIGVKDQAVGIVVGTVEYWVRLHIPMEEAFKLYKEKFKALKYIQSNQDKSDAAVKLLDQPFLKGPDVNELHIKILRCVHLKSSRADIQPSAFCMYRFYDLPDQDTAIVPNSNNPEYSDHRTFPLHMDSDLDRYLKSQNLEIYVFDDGDPDIGSYIGKTSISLLPLAQDKSVKGIFELLKDDTTGYGSIEVSLYWQHTYQFTSDSVSLPKSLAEPIEYPSHIHPVVPSAVESNEDSSENASVPLNEKRVSGIPVPLPRARPSHFQRPVSSSTPVKSSKMAAQGDYTDDMVEESAPVASSQKNELQVPPQPAVRLSKTAVNTVDEFIEYSQSFLKSSKIDIEDDDSSGGHTFNVASKESSLKEQPQGKEKQDEDTMSEKKQEISFEEISEEDKQVLAEDDTDISGSENENEKYVSSTGGASYSLSKLSAVIGILNLALDPNAPVLQDPNIRMLYVEYRFLDYPLEELETPYSLPKPVPPQKANYNFLKSFQMDPQDNYDKYQLLAEMLSANVPGASWLKFTVVSEPPADRQDLECEDVGYAYIDLQQVLRHERDIIEEDIAIYNAKDNATKVGSLNVTVKLLDVLQILQRVNST